MSDYSHSLICGIETGRVYKKQTGWWLKFDMTRIIDYNGFTSYEYFTLLYATKAHEPPYGSFSDSSK